MGLKHLTLITLLIVTLIARSQSGSLVFVSETGNPFILSVNQKNINKEAQSIVKVFDIEAGKQLIEITENIDNAKYTLIDSIIISDKSKFLGKEFTFGVVLEKNKLKLQFLSVSELSGPKEPPIPEAPKETAPLIDNSLYGNLYQSKENKPVFFNNYNKETGTCNAALTEKEVEYALNLLKKTNDEERKVKYLNTILEYNCYTTKQAIQLLELLPLEMDRMNSAKLAYAHLSDKQNANMIAVVFKFQSLKDSYNNFLKDEENIIKQKSLKCSTPIDKTKFDQLFTSIKNGGHENEKIIVAKKLLVNSCISSSQAKEIAQLFTHDRELLEFMKSAYNVLTDKENAKILGEEFQFKETKDEFLKYISK